MSLQKILKFLGEEDVPFGDNQYLESISAMDSVALLRKVIRIRPLGKLLDVINKFFVDVNNNVRFLPVAVNHLQFLSKCGCLIDFNIELGKLPKFWELMESIFDFVALNKFTDGHTKMVIDVMIYSSALVIVANVARILRPRDCDVLFSYPSVIRKALQYESTRSTRNEFISKIVPFIRLLLNLNKQELGLYF